MSTFYANLLYLCHENGIKVSNLCDIIGINKSSGTGWKRGSMPNHENQMAIAKFFKVDPDDLMYKDFDGENRDPGELSGTFTLSAEEARLIESWRKASENEKNAVAALFSIYGFFLNKEKTVVARVG